VRHQERAPVAGIPAGGLYRIADADQAIESCRGPFHDHPAQLPVKIGGGMVVQGTAAGHA
jgi:hypothetical protein